MTNTTTPPINGVGTNATRPDVADKLSGDFEYSNDVRIPGMLFGATKRSPHAHARLLGVDTSRALAHPGVVRVLTAEDVPSDNLLGHIISDQPVFVDDVARCEGEAVAFVVAISQEIAWAALDLIEVRWQPLTPIATIDDALATLETPLHPLGNVMNCTSNAETTFRRTWWSRQRGRPVAKISCSSRPKVQSPTPPVTVASHSSSPRKTSTPTNTSCAASSGCHPIVCTSSTRESAAPLAGAKTSPCKRIWPSPRWPQTDPYRRPTAAVSRFSLTPNDTQRASRIA